MDGKKKPGGKSQIHPAELNVSDSKMHHCGGKTPGSLVNREAQARSRGETKTNKNSKKI